MVGSLVVLSGILEQLKDIDQKFNYTRIVSGSGVFANVTGIIASKPYVDAEGNKFQQYAAYFD